MLSLVAGVQVMRQMIGLSALARAGPAALVKLLAPVFEQLVDGEKHTCRCPPLVALALAIPLVLAVDSGAADPGAATTAPDAQGTIEVTVRGLRDAAGSLRVKLVAAADGFPGLRRARGREAAHRPRRAAAAPPPLVVVFDRVPFGAYALVCLHDADDDATLDRTLLGLPAEGIGFSSGARIRFGPPAFEEGRFVLDGPRAEQKIEMQYGLGPR